MVELNVIYDTIRDLGVRDEVLWKEGIRKEEAINRLRVYVDAVWGAMPHEMPDAWLEEAFQETLR